MKMNRDQRTLCSVKKTISCWALSFSLCVSVSVCFNSVFFVMFFLSCTATHDWIEFLFRSSRLVAFRACCRASALRIPNLYVLLSFPCNTSILFFSVSCPPPKRVIASRIRYMCGIDFFFRGSHLRSSVLYIFIHCTYKTWSPFLSQYLFPRVADRLMESSSVLFLPLHCFLTLPLLFILDNCYAVISQYRWEDCFSPPRVQHGNRLMPPSQTMLCHGSPIKLW